MCGPSRNDHEQKRGAGAVPTIDENGVDIGSMDMREYDEYLASLEKE